MPRDLSTRSRASSRPGPPTTRCTDQSLPVSWTYGPVQGGFTMVSWVWGKARPGAAHIPGRETRMYDARSRASGVSRSAGKTRVTVVIAALVAILAVFGPRREGSALAANVPVGLPSHFAFGLTAEPDSTGLYGWMPNSGIPWDYAYAYLAAGVNTGQGWETWNPNGQYALLYAQGAASHNYTPVFTYYDLLQSNGTCGSCGEAQKDLSNLNNASLMSSYFQNFTLLMQRLGSGTYGGIAGFGKTAIVHVEPDLSGYAEQAVLDNTQCYS